MLTPRLTTVFASRWRALWFAGGILALVWFYLPREDTDAGNAQPVAGSHASDFDK